MECREEVRFNLEALDVLIRAGMLNISLYDMHLAYSMESGTNFVSMVFVKQFLHHYLIDNRSNSPITENHFQATLETLSTIVLSGLPIPDGYIFSFIFNYSMKHYFYFILYSYVII